MFLDALEIIGTMLVVALGLVVFTLLLRVAWMIAVTKLGPDEEKKDLK